MRVLFWSSTFWPSIGGVQVLGAKLLPALEQRGYQHIVVTPRSHDDHLNVTRYREIPIYRFPFWHSMADIHRLAQVRQWVVELKRAFAPDLIHINAASRSDFFHHFTAHAHAAPVLVTLHGGWPPEADRVVERTLQNAAWVTGCSEAMLGTARQLVPGIFPRSSVIHNAVDQPALVPAHLPTDAPRLLCLGRLIARKGFDLALGALSLLVDRFPNIRLTIAGDGPERIPLQEQAVRFGLGDRVDFVGPTAPDNTPTLMNSATIVVMPSRQEPFGLVALEAAAMARPVVATRVGGLPEVVLHGRTGLLVEPENVTGLAEAIAYLLDDFATATQMGRTARRRARENFSWDGYVDAYDRLYRKLITEARSKSAVSAETA